MKKKEYPRRLEAKVTVTLMAVLLVGYAAVLVDTISNSENDIKSYPTVSLAMRSSEVGLFAEGYEEAYAIAVAEQEAREAQTSAEITMEDRLGENRGHMIHENTEIIQLQYQIPEDDDLFWLTAEAETDVIVENTEDVTTEETKTSESDTAVTEAETKVEENAIETETETKTESEAGTEVQTAETAETVKSAETAETAETVETAETAETAEATNDENRSERITEIAKGIGFPSDFDLDRAVEAMDYLIEERGFSIAGAAGICGNIYAECRFDSSQIGGSHKGLCQWDKHIRWPLVRSWLSANGYSDTSFRGQLIAIFESEDAEEFEKSGLFDTMRDMTDPQTAAKKWLDKYERAPGQAEQSRKKQAQNLYDLYIQLG